MTTPADRQPCTPRDQFMKTSYVVRFKALLQDAQRDRSSYVISAPSKSGKTWSMTITDYAANQRYSHE